ncbi:toxin-antitoxin system YwqK family antitoxin [Robiginitalea sp. IMCC43444]|uniref:toxin-antitoxin system YwqK family antitoxin n=1 Tax=Robiginitalea sp. IMCC43444 TaxID=3459121 RepID=UPI0040419FB9
MKRFFIFFLLGCAALSAQEPRSMGEVTGRMEYSMADVDGKNNNGVYRYYLKGEDTPYTGILYGKHPNGQVSSWQEYVDGVGQGQWINYYDNGNYKEIGFYNQNRVEGPIRKFYEDGSLKAEGTYKDWRVKIGEWKYFNTDGSLKKTVDYGEKGSIEEVEEYYQRGDISYNWYASILRKNGFRLD